MRPMGVRTRVPEEASEETGVVVVVVVGGGDGVGGESVDGACEGRRKNGSFSADVVAMDSMKRR